MTIDHRPYYLVRHWTITSWVSDIDNRPHDLDNRPYYLDNRPYDYRPYDLDNRPFDLGIEP